MNERDPRNRPAQPASGGERPGDRQVMDRVARDLIASGTKPKDAQRVARESMLRTDRKLRDEGKR